MEWYLGEIRLFAFNYLPQGGWSACEGQILQVQQNAALFSLIGNIYGGDGNTTFALPDLRGKIVIGDGKSAVSGITRNVGDKGGVEAVTLTANNLPAHAHTITASAATTATGDLKVLNDNANSSDPTTAVAIASKAGNGVSMLTSTATTTVMKGAITNIQGVFPSNTNATGANAPMNVMQPYTVLKYCIATTGIYPQRA